jgi:hypothetical protein
MSQKIAKIVLLPFVLLLAFFPLSTFALEPGETKPIFEVDGNPAEVGIGAINTALGKSPVVATSNVSDLVFKYVNFALPLLALAAFAGFVYAGFLFVFDFGSDEQVGKAKKVMMYAVIGMVLVILSYSIVQLFAKGLATSVQTQLQNP